MRSLFLAFLFTAAALETRGTDVFMKPHDPVMDEVAKILTGILTNLQKHKSLVSVTQAVASARVTDGFTKPHDPVMDEVAKILTGILTNLQKHKSLVSVNQAVNKVSDQIVVELNKIEHDKASLLGVVSELQQPEAKTIRDLAKVPAGEAATVLFVDTSCEKYSDAAEKVVAEAGAKAIIVDASQMTAPGLVDRTPEMYFVPADGSLPRRFQDHFTKGMVETFVKDTSSGKADERRVLVHTEANTTANTTAAAIEVPEVSSEELFAAMKQTNDDLLIVFYSPNCGHCKQFVTADNAPLTQLHDQLKEKGAENLSVMRMDVSSWPELPVAFPAIEYVPAVFFAPADRKSLVDYEGAYDIPAVLAFITANAQASKATLA